VGSPPDQRAELEAHEAGLLVKLSSKRVLVGLARFDAASGRRPNHSIAEVEANEQDPVGLVDDHGTRCQAKSRFAH
jgi:hypothetical protein